MNILVVGTTDSVAEFKLKFGSNHFIDFKSSSQLEPTDLISPQVVFDFEISSVHSHAHLYSQNPNIILLVNVVKSTVKDMVNQFGWSNSVIGFNGLPGMFNRPILELSVDLTDPAIVQSLCKELGTDYRIVGDRIGMVTPRVICMIINEACYTVQEGTANEQDIDLAMKLGTNYPSGPFEMLQSIGISNVYELLQSLFLDTGDIRYRVSPLLEKLYLRHS